MKRIALLILLLTACAPITVTQVPSLARQPAAMNTPRPTSTIVPSITPSPTTDAMTWARVTMLFANATDTQAAIAKTERANRDAQSTQVSDTQAAEILSTAQAGQTQAMQTAQATMTQAAQTQSANITATVLAVTQQSERDRANAARFGLWFGISAVFVLVVLGLAWLGVRIWRDYKNAQAEFLQGSKMERDVHGRAPIVPESAVPGNGVLLDVDKGHRVRSDAQDLTTEQALANAHDQRELEGVRAIAEGRARKPATSQAGATVETMDTPRNLLTASNNLPQPAWNILDGWDGRGIPYGLSGAGLMTMDINQTSHVGVFGQTGSGKSRYFLRTFIAGAIAAGHRVVILGKQGDYWPFAQHPNVKMIGVRQVTEGGEAQRYADYLRRLAVEMNKRDEYLTASHMSTWERAGRENTLIVLDELGNALRMMPVDKAKEAYRWVEGLVNEGRKVGFNVILASQRAVGFKSIVEQMGRAVFYLADADASRIAIGFPGAQELKDGHFLARFGKLSHCVAFDPTDDELTAFLNSRPVEAHEPMEWIEGSVSDLTTDPFPSGKGSSEAARDVEIWRRCLEGQSLAQIQREVFGDATTGGAHFNQIKDVIARYKGATSTATTTKLPEMGMLAA